MILLWATCFETCFLLNSSDHQRRDTIGNMNWLDMFPNRVPSSQSNKLAALSPNKFFLGGNSTQLQIWKFYNCYNKKIIKFISIKTTIYTSSLKPNKCGMDKLNNTQYIRNIFRLTPFNIIHPVCSLRNAGSSVIKTLAGSDLSFLCTWHISSLL